MKVLKFVFVAACLVALPLDARAEAAAAGEGLTGEAMAQSVPPPAIGQPGWRARYDCEVSTGLRGSVVKTYVLTLGPIEIRRETRYQWILLDAVKANGERFRVWLLSAGYPPLTLAAARESTARYILQEGDSEPTEFRERFTGRAVLPAVGGWKYLMPRAAMLPAPDRSAEVFPPDADYLGHRYRRQTLEAATATPIPVPVRTLELLPSVLVGFPHNTRQKDDQRRYDDSDYELVRLTRQNYREMAEAGISCFRVDAEQLPWIEGLNVFYWGLGVKDVPYPECLYRSSYLGPEIFLDEPAVGTRDFVLRPRLATDAAFRKSLTPQVAFEAFQEYFAAHAGVATNLVRELAARPDVDLGQMTFAQENVFSWETMVSTAAYQLSRDPVFPAAMVFEPPGRVGTCRTLPELNMTYGCQLPVDDPKYLTDIIYGFLRGAARLTDKSWGMSVYGAVDRADAFWFMTHAYDLGATRFFFWDAGPTASVPYRECLALARNLRAHVENFPHRDLPQLQRAAEVAILLPPGYNLGHVQLGKGSLWGLGELNLERINRSGVKYRQIMGNFFTEIENCLRLGVAFDLLWDLPGNRLSGYRETIRIREDGKIEVEQDGKPSETDHARMPARPAGVPPELEVRLSSNPGKAPLDLTALARVVEKSAPVFYTLGTDPDGVYQNAVVAWELYGPGEEDYRPLQPPRLQPRVDRRAGRYEVAVNFRIAKPGNYRLRAATVDLAGRSTVVWTSITVTE